MESANFNTKNFLAGSATLAINSDEISAFKTFYGALNIQLAAAHSRNTMYLPPFGDLSPHVPLRTQIYPPSHFSGHSTVKFHLDFVGTLIHNLLDRHSLTEKAPKARMHIDEVIHSSSDGWDVLEYLSKKTIPFLGRLDLDVDELIQNLQVSQGVHVKDFLSQVQRVSQTINIAGVKTSPNKLLKQFFTQLMRCSNLVPLIAPKYHEFRTFLTKYGPYTEYQSENVQSLVQFLLDGTANDVIELLPSANENQPSNTTRSSKYQSRPYRHQTYAALELPADSTVDSQEITPPPSDRRSQNQPLDHEELSDVDSMLKDLVAPVLASLEFENPDENLQNLVFQAMTSMFQKKGPCKVCGGRHDADTCRARGPEFQQPWLRKAVAQYNAVHGDKPKIPPPDNPPIPQRADFGKATNLQKRNMEVYFDESDFSTTTSDQNSDENSSENSSENFNENDLNSQGLELRAVTTNEELDNALDEIAKDLENSLDQNDLQVKPEFALLDVSTLTSSQKHTPSTPPSDDASTPMSIADYDLYDFASQVKA